MTTCTALLRKDPVGDHGVAVPDFPGCVTAGRTREEARRMAVEAWDLHIAGMLQDRETIPAPSRLDDITADCANRDAVILLVDAQTRPSRAIRIDVMRPGYVVRAIDRTTRNRSRLLADAARAKRHAA